MVTAIGQTTVTSIARRFIMPTITDQVYPTNVFLYRLMKANKKLIQGGTQIEVPALYKRFAAGGFYRGLDPLDMTPSDTIRNLVFDWKQAYVPLMIDGRTLIRVDSPEAIANHLQLQAQQAFMEFGEILANAVLDEDGVADDKSFDGLPGAVGNAVVGNPNYGGIARSSNPWLNAAVDASTTTMTFNALHASIMAASRGGQHPTIGLTRQEQYNRAYALGTAGGHVQVQQTRAPGGHDEMLLSAGFTNILVDNIPLVVDPHVGDGPNANNGRIYWLNENTFHLVVTPRADFYMEDFQKPINQDAVATTILFAGNLVNTAPNLNGVMTNVSA